MPVTFHFWVKAAGGLDGSERSEGDLPLLPHERQELLELRRKPKQIQREHEILEKRDEQNKSIQWTVLPRST